MRIMSHFLRSSSLSAAVSQPVHDFEQLQSMESSPKIEKGGRGGWLVAKYEGKRISANKVSRSFAASGPRNGMADGEETI